MTATRFAPAAVRTAGALRASIPPIAEEERQLSVLARVPDQRLPDRSAARLRRRGVDRAHADVVGQRLARRRYLPRRVRGDAHDRIRPEQGTRLVHGGVLLTNVDAVGLALERQLGPVVHHQ